MLTKENKISREDVVNKEYLVLNGGKFYFTGPCKLSLECKSHVRIGAKVIINEVIENTDEDKAKYPFIVTKITPITPGIFVDYRKNIE